MSSKPEVIQPLQMGESDCFLLSIDREMQRTGQGIHLNQTVLELQGTPDEDRLRSALRKLVERHPVLTFAPRSCPGFAPVLAPSRRPAATIPLRIWEEQNDPAALGTYQEALLHQTEAEFHEQGTIQLHVCLVRQRDGNSMLLFTWRHLALDGFGAEMLACELDAIITHGGRYAAFAAAPQVRAARQATWWGHFRAAQPAANYFRDLLGEYRFQSLGSARPEAKMGKFSVETLSEQDGELIARQAAARSGLMTGHYYLACATQAHHRLWTGRGQPPPAYLMSVPVRARKPGNLGPIFQNNMTFLFFWATAGEAEDIATLCIRFQQQHARFLRDGLADSFLHLQYLMRPVPSRLYSWHLKQRMRGELNSFYHSQTGEFAPDLRSFASCPVRNGYHIPMVFNPPGTGLFLSHRDGRVTVTMSWREGVLLGDEVRLLKDHFIEALRTG
jgi:hypothetical protein